MCPAAGGVAGVLAEVYVFHIQLSGLDLVHMSSVYTGSGLCAGRRHSFATCIATLTEKVGGGTHDNKPLLGNL